MNEDNFKIILDKALAPIKKQLEDIAPIKKQLGDLDVIKQQIEDPKTGLKSINVKLGDLDVIKQQIEDPKTGLKSINVKLDAVWEQTVKLTEEMEETKDILKSHGKDLKQIKDNEIKINKRLIFVEGHLGISAPPELATIS